MAIVERQKTREQEAKLRAKNFDEVSLGFDEATALVEAERCLNCKNAKCIEGCPVNINIPAFIAKLKYNDVDGAIGVIKQESNLPAICGRVCPQESQCEKMCIRKAKLGGSVAIGALERYVADAALAKGCANAGAPIFNGKKIAVIGSGPAGLTAAADLAKAGCKVVIFEAFHTAGGVLVYGIPEFRLPKKLVQAEIDGLKALGVEIMLNTVIGKTIMLDELLEEYDAIFIGTGAGLPMFQNIPGENLNGVYSANEYLTRINLMKAYDKNSNTPVQVGKNVAVVGAGNVAMDAARTALRMGADNVYIIYRRGREEMPAREEELIHAEQEGIIFKLLTNPVAILGEKRVEGLRCIKMELGEPDASGRRRPVAIEGSEYDMVCDQVIMALGTSPNPLLKNSYPELQTNKRGTIIINEDTNMTSVDGVFAGGDAVTGSATVILAMGAGKKAAKAILQRLGL